MPDSKRDGSRRSDERPDQTLPDGTLNVPPDIRDTHGDAGPGVGAARDSSLDMDRGMRDDPTYPGPAVVERPHRAVAPSVAQEPTRQPNEPLPDVSQPTSGIAMTPEPTGPIGPDVRLEEEEKKGRGGAPGSGSWGSG